MMSTTRVVFQPGEEEISMILLEVEICLRCTTLWLECTNAVFCLFFLTTGC